MRRVQLPKLLQPTAAPSKTLHAKTYVMELTSPDLPEAQWPGSPIVGEARPPLQVLQQARYLGVTL